MADLGPFALGHVHCADCLEAMKALPDGCIETIVTDPVWPNSSSLLPGSDNPWKLFRLAAAHFHRLAKRVVVHLGCGSDPRFLSCISRRLPFFRICWLEYAVPSYQGRLLNGADVAYVFGAPPSSRPGRRVMPGRCCDSRKPDFPRGLARNRPHGAGVAAAKKLPHPTMRHLAHVRWLVNWFSESGPVLDPFAGGGTTGIACVELGRPFLGFEINRRFARFANQRLAAATSGLTFAEHRAGQRTLFPAKEAAHG